MIIIFVIVAGCPVLLLPDRVYKWYTHYIHPRYHVSVIIQIRLQMNWRRAVRIVNAHSTSTLTHRAHVRFSGNLEMKIVFVRCIYFWYKYISLPVCSLFSVFCRWRARRIVVFLFFFPFRSFNSLYFHLCHAYTFSCPKVILYFTVFFSFPLSFPFGALFSWVTVYYFSLRFPTLLQLACSLACRVISK